MKRIIEKQDEIIARLKKFIKMNSWGYGTHAKFTEAKHSAWFDIVQLESELAQLKAEAEQEVSDEDIDRASNDDFNKTNYYSYQHAYQNGAKAMRDNLIKKG